MSVFSITVFGDLSPVSPESTLMVMASVRDESVNLQARWYSKTGDDCAYNSEFNCDNPIQAVVNTRHGINPGSVCRVVTMTKSSAACEDRVIEKFPARQHVVQCIASARL